MQGVLRDNEGSGRTGAPIHIIIYPNLEFPTGLKMETVSLQRAFRAGSEDEGLLPRLQSLGEHGPRLVWLYCVIEDVVRQILGETRLRSRGPTPELVSR